MPSSPRGGIPAKEISHNEIFGIPFSRFNLRHFCFAFVLRAHLGPPALGIDSFIPIKTRICLAHSPVFY